MATQTGAEKVIFGDHLAKPAHVLFDAEALTSDAGAVLLAALDREIDLSGTLAGSLSDPRDRARVRHPWADLVGQRLYGIAQGYADCNDATHLRSDPGIKVALGRRLDESEDLASTATLCRFENAVTSQEVVEAGRSLERWILNRLQKRFRRAKRVTIDLDSTPDPTHGQQVFTFFDAHVGEYTYKPLFVWISFDRDPEQYLVAARLRPGTCGDVRTVIPLLRRVIREIRQRFKKAAIRVRADAGFGKNPRLLDFLDGARVEYVLGLPPNGRLKALAEPLVAEVVERSQSEGTVGQESQIFDEFRYKTQKTWPIERRVVAKAEVTATHGRDPRPNVRFVVTNRMGRLKPRSVYRTYRRRGDPENRIKELKHLEVDRTSCSRFPANAFRVLLVSAAYMLLQELRWRVRRTELARAQVPTIQLRLLKVAARVVQSVRRFVFHLPKSFPWERLWRKAALATGAVPG